MENEQVQEKPCGCDEGSRFACGMGNSHDPCGCPCHNKAVSLSQPRAYGATPTFSFSVQLDEQQAAFVKGLTPQEEAALCRRIEELAGKKMKEWFLEEGERFGRRLLTGRENN